MARILETYEFPLTTRRRLAERYEAARLFWDQHLDGSIWRCEAGEEFAPGDERKFEKRVRNAARIRNLGVRVKKEDGSVVFQAHVLKEKSDGSEA